MAFFLALADHTAPPPSQPIELPSSLPFYVLSSDNDPCLLLLSSAAPTAVSLVDALLTLLVLASSAPFTAALADVSPTRLTLGDFLV